MKLPPSRRIANVIQPVTRDFFVSSRLLLFPGNSIEERSDWKSKCPQWRERIPPKISPNRSFELGRLPVDRQGRLFCKSFKQDLTRRAGSTEPRRARRVVKHAVQVIVLLRVKAPGRLDSSIRVTRRSVRGEESSWLIGREIDNPLSRYLKTRQRARKNAASAVLRGSSTLLPN